MDSGDGGVSSNTPTVAQTETYSVPDHGSSYPVLHLNPKTKKAYVSMLSLAMMNVAIIAGIGNSVQMAFYGFSSVTFFVIGAIVFFIPTALVAAELATGWAENGGIFRWVSEGVGRGWGFMCVFILWIQQALVLAQCPASYTSTILFFSPNFNKAIAFAENPTQYLGEGGFIGIMIAWLVFLWALAWMASRGVKAFDKIASWGVTLGTILPLLFMVIFIFVWLGEGHRAACSFSGSALLPQWQGMSTIALAASVFFSYAGIDMNAAYVKQLKNPEKQYPRALLLTIFICLCIFLFSTLVVAAMVPESQINVIYTLNAVFKDLGATIGFPMLYLVVVYLGLFNMIAGNITAFAAPSLMLGQSGRAGMLPKWLQRTNKHGMPSGLMFVQCVILTILSFVIELIPNVEGFVILLTQAMTVLYLVYYILMFITFVRLRYTQPNRPRAFKCPGGKTGAWIVAIIGIAASCLGILMSVWPPAQVAQEVGSPEVYVWTIIVICCIILAIPFLIYWAARKHNWVDPENKFAPLTWQIEGFKKPTKSLSNIPTAILSYDQNPMGMPIKHPFSPDDRMDNLPTQLVDDVKAVGSAA